MVSLRTSSATAQQQSSVIVKIKNVVPKMSFFENFCKDFPDGVASVLSEEGFDTLPALLSASREDIEGLKTKKGHIAPVREAVTVLQFQHGKAPLCVGLPQDSNSDQRQDARSGSPNITISQLLGSPTVKEQS